VAEEWCEHRRGYLGKLHHAHDNDVGQRSDIPSGRQQCGWDSHQARRQRFTVNAAAVAPTITAQPVSQTVTAGQTASFVVAATGTAPLTYQWQKSGVNIAGANSASYTTPATTTSDNGATFRVVVSSTAGTATSAAATLTVNVAAVAPAIAAQPVNQTVTAGQAAGFSVAATGTAPLSYQWQKSGVNIAGANSASYTTPATTPFR